MAGRIRAFDWSQTSLGPIKAWSERLATMVEQALANPAVSSLVCGPDRVLIYNDAAARLYGDRHPAALGQPLPDAFPAGWRTVAPLYERVFAGEAVQVAAQPLDTRGEGGKATDVFDALLLPVREADGRVAYALMIGFEVGERVRSEARLRETEERQAFVLKLSDALRPIGDPVKIQRTATRMLGEHLKVSRVFYVVVDKDGDTADILSDYTDGVPSRVGRYSLPAFSTYAVGEWRVGRNASSSDVNIDPRYSEAERRAYASVSTRAGFGIPLIKEGRLVALLGVNQSTARRWTDHDFDLAGETAERVWAAVERARAEAELRNVQATLAAAFESVPVGVAAIDLSGTTVISNAEYRRLLPTGVVPSRDPERGARWQGWDPQGQLLERHDYPAARAMRGESVVPGQEMLYRDDDGREIWTSVATVPTRDAQGQVTGLVTAIADIDATKRSAQALRESEERLRGFGEASTDVLWIRDAETLGWTYLTPAFETIYGLPRDEALAGNNYRSWLDLIEPGDRDHAREMISRARNGERITFEYRVRRPSDGQLRWLRNTDFPIRNADGEVVAIGGVGHDATLEKEAEETLRESEGQLQVLVAELHHRTRNLIGIVGMIMRQVLASSASLADFRARFTERLEALSRVQSLLSRKDDEPVGIGDIVRIELNALGADLRSDRVRLEGEAVPIRKSKVQTLSLAIHELATNALKYGALHGDSGHLAVRWGEYRSETNERRLSLQWTETGVEARVEETEGPLHKGGYGRTLLEEALPYTLKAKTSYTLGKDRLNCTIDMPLDR